MSSHVGWPSFALAFRGFNTTNLGRTAEILGCDAYAAILRRHLSAASETCAAVVGTDVDLEERVVKGCEAELDCYSEAIALVFAVETAQIEMLREVHGVDSNSAELSFGYSLGELVALAASGVLDGDEVVRVPLAMAPDCAALADNVTMGVLFSREHPIDEGLVDRLCDELSVGGEQISVSAVLSPNSLLLLGQGRTIEHFRSRMADAFPSRVHLRLNDARWPPLHTPIVRQKHVPDRSAVMIQSIPIHADRISPPVISLVNGQPVPPDPVAIRGLLRDWVDHRQRLWDVVCGVLHSSVQTVVHVGPAPNVIPATFGRLAENLRQLQAKNNLSGIGARALGQIVDRPWLASRIPTSAALLRAPQIEHVILEDWLIENAPA